MSNGLGNWHQDQGQPEAALAAYRQAVNYDPSLVTAQRRLGAACANAGDFEQALAALEAAVALEPEHAPTQYNLGIVYLCLGDVELAQRAFEQVLALAPGSQWAKQAQDQLDQLNP